MHTQMKRCEHTLSVHTAILNLGLHFYSRHRGSQGKALGAAAPPGVKDAPIVMLMCPLKHGSEAAIWVHRHNHTHTHTPPALSPQNLWFFPTAAPTLPSPALFQSKLKALSWWGPPSPSLIHERPRRGERSMGLMESVWLKRDEIQCET